MVFHFFHRNYVSQETVVGYETHVPFSAQANGFAPRVSNFQWLSWSRAFSCAAANQSFFVDLAARHAWSRPVHHEVFL